MLTGTGDYEELASGGAHMPSLDTDPVSFEGARLFQLMCEIDSSVVEELLPPSLHPTLPGLVSWQVLDCPDSPWGGFRMALTRIECRSGLRPRGFVISGRIDNDEAKAALSQGWGYPLASGEIAFRHSYDATYVGVEAEGISMLELWLRNPEPLTATDIQYVSDCHLAHTPRGVRLVQADPRYSVRRAERGVPEVVHFDASEWGDERVHPVYPVSASVTTVDVTLPKLRYLCLPDQMAFTGTEVL